MITNREIENYFYCSLKAQNYRQHLEFETTPLLNLNQIIIKLIKVDILKKWKQTSVDMRKIVSDHRFVINEIETIIPYIEKNKNLITPVFISPQYRISKEAKNTFSFKTQLLSKQEKKPISYYKIVLPNLSIKRYKALNLPDINLEKELNEKIEITKKKHCTICEFQKNCNDVLKERNDIRTLTGIKENQVLKWNEKGYFTVLQLSYKFRPRKRSTILKSSARYKFELKALAIREKKVFITTPPLIKNSKLELYVDFESLPDENYVYLIGIVIVEDNIITKKLSYWANNIEEEKNIFSSFFNLLTKLNTYQFYHYGNYEIRQLKRFNKSHNNLYAKFITEIENQSINVLKYFFSDIYPPTYSNGLKDIANYIGFNWSNKNSSGLNSIIWRKKWELTSENNFKLQLLQYNLEDCIALFEVKKWISNIKLTDNESLSIDEIVNTTHLKFGKIDFQLAPYNDINKTAYFDYQRTKIYIKTESSLKKKTHKLKKRTRIKENTNVYANRPEECPKCSNKQLYIHQKYRRYLIDLKFTQNGIKRWVTLFNGKRFRCSICNNVFIESKYYRQSTFGRNLQIWIIYNYINYNISYSNLSQMLDELFNIKVTRTYVSNIKKQFAQKLAQNYNEILLNILKGSIIHIDETTVKVKSHKGYVWVFTNMTQVYYMYRPNRECEFLVSLLENFEGVLISDFYGGYDSLKCRQQKCLIHLMRDINDLVFKNQNNKEILIIAKSFGNILKNIVSTIDKYGLKKRNLNKHKKEVNSFFKRLEVQNFTTIEAIKIRKRLIKNQTKLFAFLNFNGIPWNNNNAEFAIKSFAKYRRIANGIYNEKGLKDYLVMLSISKSCQYQNVNFLDFLKKFDVENKKGDNKV